MSLACQALCRCQTRTGRPVRRSICYSCRSPFARRVSRIIKLRLFPYYCKGGLGLVKYCENILETIGRTPLVKLQKVTKGVRPTVLAKVEVFNPGGSIKD